MLVPSHATDFYRSTKGSRLPSGFCNTSRIDKNRKKSNKMENIGKCHFFRQLDCWILGGFKLMEINIWQRLFSRKIGDLNWFFYLNNPSRDQFNNPIEIKLASGGVREANHDIRFCYLAQLISPAIPLSPAWNLKIQPVL